MIYYYSLGFDMSLTPDSTFSLSVQRQGVSETITVTAADIITKMGAYKCFNYGILGSTIYYHKPSVPLSTMTASGWASSHTFVMALAAAMLDETTEASWATYLDFSLGTDGKLTISSHNGTQQFYIIVNNTATQWILGHAAGDNGTLTTSRKGTWAMKYCIVPYIPYPNNDSGIYEAESMASVAIPSSGALPYGYSRGYCPLYHDWKHVGEPSGNIYGYTSATYPFGWDFFFAHCHKGYPFFLYDNITNLEVYYLRPDCKFEPKKTLIDDATNWEIELRTIYAGYV